MRNAPAVCRITVLGMLAALALSTGCADVPPNGLADAGPTSTTDALGTTLGDATTSGPETIVQAPDPLELRSVEPTEGSVNGGIAIVLTGRGFRAGLEIYFDQSPGLDIIVVNTTTAIARLPPHPAGKVDVSVAHPDDHNGAPQTIPSIFRYSEPVVVSAIEPVVVPVDGGNAVVVRGLGFTSDSRAFVGGRPLLQQAINGDAITGIVSPGPWGPADVHVTGFNGVGALVDGYLYGAVPQITSLSPIVGLPGDHVVISGAALGDDAEVFFDEAPAEVVDHARDGGWLEVLAPAGSGLVDVRVQTAWGIALEAQAFAYRDDSADPLVLACTHVGPAHGALAGGDVVAIACRGLAYPDLAVRFGDVPATITDVDAASQRLIVTTPPGSAPGTVAVTVSSAVASTRVGTDFTYLAPAALALTSISPDSGSPLGGTRVTLHGRGFQPGAVVQIGALAATQVTVVDDTTISATTAPGAPGNAPVTVRQSGLAARLDPGFDYTSDTVALALVAPTTFAQAGNTYLRVYGAGFDDQTTITIGGVVCPIITRVSSAEVHVRSPHVAVGVYDAVATTADARQATLVGAVTVFDPRGAYGGTWGPPIDETLNVTVYGSSGYGPIAGAYVIVGNDASTPWQGVTDENGQVTLSGPGFVGPVEVTASREKFTSYSVLTFDATNVTIVLTQNPTPPQQGGGGGNPYIPPPNATISGHVRGLEKYVVAPPGSCAGLAIEGTPHCRRCGDGASIPQCDGGFACVAVGDEGTYCAAACEADDQCPDGYACGATTAGGRCLPSLGAVAGYCNVSSTSTFSYEYPIQATGWIDAEGHYSIDSTRLGEVAVYCYGGYKDGDGVFTPTIMGVARHLFASPSGVIADVDIDLVYKLDRSFRLRLQDPPTWSTGLLPPSVIISLDLGADGALPLSRTLIEGSVETTGDDTGLTWIAPHELTETSGALYDGKFFFYTTLSPANVTSYQPRAYNLVQNITRVVEDRFPVRSVTGTWSLEGSGLERDLYAVWATADGRHAFAVGERGQVLGFLQTSAGGIWTMQPSVTKQSLRAVDGRALDDVWAVGDGGTVLHWDGISWKAVASAPNDDYRAVAATADGIYLAGAIRLRRYEPATSTWTVVGGPALQQVHGLQSLPDGRVLAFGTGGRVWVSSDPTTWTPVALPAGVDATLNAAIVRADGTWVLVGEQGTLVAGPEGALVRVASGTTLPLNALAEVGGDVVIVGDHGATLLWPAGQAVRVDEIRDYRSEAHGVFVDDTGKARVVGAAAFVLGPFLHFPIVTSPVHDATLDSLAFAWTWDAGPANQYTQLRLTPEGQITAWTLIVNGAQQSVLLPDLEAAAGIIALPPGRVRFEVLRVLNLGFDIDSYTTREFSIYSRDSWSTNEATFYLPP